MANILHENLLLVIRIMTYLTPPLLILLGFILIEINYASSSITLDWRTTLIGALLIILGGALMAIELYLNVHKHPERVK
jgi:hypothetical protein